MVKRLFCGFLAAGLLQFGILPAQEKTAKPDAQAKKAPGPVERGPREGSPGVTYGPAAATRVDAPKFAGLRIYWVTADTKSFRIHGFNKSGFTLALASDDRITRRGFHPSVTFANQYANGSKTVGTPSGSGNVWVARGPDYDFLGNVRGPSHDEWVQSWSRPSRPPVLPEDGKTVIVSPQEFPEGGSEALFLNFPTSPQVTFLIVPEAKTRFEQCLCPLQLKHRIKCAK
jgi:hypothetical protein